MRTSPTLAALALASFLAPAANAAPVAFDASPEAPARRIVNVVFAQYLQERVGASIETAVLDLDGDGTGEIAVRFVHTGSCAEGLKKCRTAVIRHDAGEWRIVLDRHAESLDFGGPSGPLPGPLAVDGVTWRWGKGFAYAPDGKGLGTEVSFQAVPAASAQSYAAAFGEGAQRLAAGGHGVRISYSTDKVADGAETMLVKMEGGVSCGEATGCPVRLLRKDGDKWTPVLSTTTKGKLAVTDTVRAGYRDIVVETKLGYAVLGWNGNGYAVADRFESTVRGR